MGGYSSAMPVDNSQDTGILSFLDSLVKTAGNAYTVSQGGSTTQTKNLYQNTASPNQTSLSLGGFTTAEIMIIGIIVIAGIFLVMKR